MACNNINPSVWDWKHGDTASINIKGLTVPYNYFSCGLYYFDGDFKVVKFPKGMKLFHGSSALANAGVEFPVGAKFYNSERRNDIISKPQASDIIKNNSNFSIQEVLSLYEKDFPATWFGDLKTAQLYSKQNDKNGYCGDKCIFVYTLKRDAVFIVLDDNFNIWRFLNYPGIPPDILQYFKKMYNISDLAQTNNHPTQFGNLFIQNKKRRSFREFDLPFVNWMCSVLPQNKYAGYASNHQMLKKTVYFHLEFSFCNAMQYLKRDLQDPLDWQHSDMTSADKIIRSFFQQLSYYKSENTGFHSGDLLEHSIWSLLFAEQLLINTPASVITTTRDAKKNIAVMALLHDIGKMDPSSCTKRKNDLVYFSMPNHPKLGGDYIRGTKKIPLLDKDMNIVGKFDIKALLTAFGVLPEDYDALASVVDNHWFFGEYLQKWSGPDDIATPEAYIQKISEGYTKSFLWYYSLLVVSYVDILATQPYGMNNLTVELNHRSVFFPFISNMPKKYSGTNLADATAEKRNAFFFVLIESLKN
jgi:hypothetical protein